MTSVEETFSGVVGQIEASGTGGSGSCLFTFRVDNEDKGLSFVCQLRSEILSGLSSTTASAIVAAFFSIPKAEVEIVGEKQKEGHYLVNVFRAPPS